MKTANETTPEKKPSHVKKIPKMTKSVSHPLVLIPGLGKLKTITLYVTTDAMTVTKNPATDAAINGFHLG